MPNNKKRVKSEETIIKDIEKLLNLLKKEHRSACLFAMSSKRGVIQFGSSYAVGYFERHLSAWMDCFDLDENEMIYSDEAADEESIGTTSAYTGCSVLPKKLPAPIGLMSYEELWKWLTVEILKEHWKAGGNERFVKFGRDDFNPSFWINEIWDWSSIKKHPKDLTKADFPGEGNMTSFLKKVVKKRLEMLGIAVENWISNAFFDAVKRKRMRTRKLADDVSAAIEDPAVDDFLTVELSENEEEGVPPPSNRGNNNETIRGVAVSNADETVRRNHVNNDDNDTISRRCSARLANRRAASSSLSTISEVRQTFQPSEPPLAISPLSSDASRHASSLSRPLPFIPRRKRIKSSKKKTILVPHDLVDQFQAIAQIHTENGVELGGVLAGMDTGEGFRFTDLIIPHQICFSDRYEITDEHQIADFFERNSEKILLGLVHTHPRWDSFLSSVDLHALYTYASQNPNVVSFVLAPEKGTFPAFCLTAKGMDILEKCKKEGFHQHKNAQNLYEEAKHVVLDNRSSINVTDFRLMTA